MTGFVLIPHPPVDWEQVRAMDILFLLTLGAASEFLLRGIVLAVKRKPDSLRSKEDAFFKLEYETIKLRNKGPSAFVETSKSERQLLALDKELQLMYSNRSKQRVLLEKWCLQYIRTTIHFVVFLVYFGVPVVSFSGVEEPAKITVPMFFPLSVAELGFRMISQWGLEQENVAVSALGALVVVWSGSGLVGQLVEGIEHLVLT